MIPKPLLSHVKSKPSSSSSSSSSPCCYNLYNAATSNIRNQVQPSSIPQIQQAIKDSHDAQQQWYHDYTPTQRSQILLKASQLLQNNTTQQSILQMEVYDTSRPIHEIQSYDIPTTIETLNYYSCMSSIIPSGVTYNQMSLSSTNDQSFAYTMKQPIGVTIGIGAWNYPLVNAVMKSAPALIFGNSMIYKPSELTPCSTIRLAEIYEEAGLPKGVFQVLLGNGDDVGKTLIQEYMTSLSTLSSSSSSSINMNMNTHGKISFTGSVRTGRDIASMVSSSTTPNNQKKNTMFHRLNLELGGKSPLIIMKDCNITHAVQNAIKANFYSNGQVCSNGTRVYVHELIYDEFISLLVQQTKQLKIGNPFDYDVDIGPMISKEHMENVLNYIDIGKNYDGATLLYGGERLTLKNMKSSSGNGDDDNYELLSNGYFLSPAIFTNCNDNMRIVQEEVFGMLMSVLTFNSEEEVIQRANANEYGLAAGIITNDLKQAHRMASKINASTVWINNYNVGNVSLPWGAMKQSGVGSETGSSAIDSWTTEKVIYVDLE